MTRIKPGPRALWQPPAMLRGIASALALAANTIAMSLALMPAAIVKLAVPATAVRRACDRILNAVARRWMANNDLWIAAAGNRGWDVQGLEGIERDAWYVVAANHQSWVDIFVLQRTLGRRAPLLKFFLKRELIYVPVIGLAWWALDFPFMRRTGGREDIANARRACGKFRAVPTAVLSFAEGTRFSAEKARRQGSPYRHLLKPKAGGVAVALEALADRLDGVLDVTLVYPHGVPTFWDLLAGRVADVKVRVRRLPPPQKGVQAWINELWLEKDREIAALGA